MTISLAEMPSLVTLVWAAAGRWVSARALTARPNALNDFDIANSFSLARVERRLGPYDPSPFSKNSDAKFDTNLDDSSHRPFAIHGVDFRGVTLVHEAALQLHGRRQFLVLGRQLALDQEEALDGLDPREIDVDRLDLALDQILDFGRAAQAGIVGEGNVVVLRELLDILLIDHDQTRQVRPLVADDNGIGNVG